jgi:hypothetical protein
MVYTQRPADPPQSRPDIRRRLIDIEQAACQPRRPAVFMNQLIVYAWFFGIAGFVVQRARAAGYAKISA